MRLSLFYLFFLTSIGLLAAPGYQDLKKLWLINVDGKLSPYNQTEKNLQSITIFLNTTDATGSRIKILYPEPISVFLNNNLIINSKQEVLLSVDSLRKLTGITALQISVYHQNLNPKKLSTFLIKDFLVEDAKLTPKENPAIPLDFVIISALIISLLLLTIILLNPKLASDYFSVVKLFSFREREEGQVYNRITGSTNFLFFGFSALTLSLVLTLSKPFLKKGGVENFTLADYSFEWINNTGWLLLIVALRMVNTYFQSWLYNTRDVAGLQFFNWIRAIFLLSGFCLFLIVLSHVTSITNAFWLNALFQIVLFGTLFWNVIATFKVANKVQLGLFHLFSYLCVTEIIPSLIIFKLLY